MIPFAILSGSIERRKKSGPWRAEKEIRISELSPDSFTFRLADPLPPPEREEAERIVLQFSGLRNTVIGRLCFWERAHQSHSATKQSFYPGIFYRLKEYIRNMKAALFENGCSGKCYYC